MASRVLPSFFRRRTPEEAYETEKRRWVAEQKRQIMERVRRRSGAPSEGAPPVIRCYESISLDGALAREFDKRRWIAEQKRLIAKARRRPRDGPSNGAIDFDARRYGGMSLEEELAYEFDTRQRLAEAEAVWLSRVRDARWNDLGHGAPEAAAVDNRRRDDPKVHPLVTEEEIVPGRGDEGYHAKRREFLKSFRFTREESA